VGGEFAIMPELIQLALKITPAAQLRERDQQVDGEDKEVPHTTNRTMAVNALGCTARPDSLILRIRHPQDGPRRRVEAREEMPQM
jgi:hypothetical protein